MPDEDARNDGPRWSTPGIRDALMHGARDAITEHGLRDVRIPHILTAAGISRRTLYQYFRSKDELLLALYADVCADLLVRIRVAAEEAEGGTKLFAGIDAYLDFQEFGGRLITQLQAEAVSPSSPMHAEREATMDAMVSYIDAEVRAVGGPAIPALAYRSIFIAIEGLVISKRAGGELTRPDREAIAAVIKPLLMRVVTGAKWFEAT